MTPLSYVPGGKIERYLGNLNFFFIRESTCIREVRKLYFCFYVSYSGTVLLLVGRLSLSSTIRNFRIQLHFVA
jgi:hypothetical protein